MHVRTAPSMSRSTPEAPAPRQRFTQAELSGQNHPVGRELDRISETGVKRVARLIDAGRRDGSIPPGPPARPVAMACMGALEGAVIALAGQEPHDELLAARAVAGVLGLNSPPAP